VSAAHQRGDGGHVKEDGKQLSGHHHRLFGEQEADGRGEREEDEENGEEWNECAI
jgi:hypothetical protein